MCKLQVYFPLTTARPPPHPLTREGSMPEIPVFRLRKSEISVHPLPLTGFRSPIAAHRFPYTDFGILPSPGLVDLDHPGESVGRSKPGPLDVTLRRGTGSGHDDRKIAHRGLRRRQAGLQ